MTCNHKLTTDQLLAKATRVFNRYIRNRDTGKVCISCGLFKTLQAGHFYSAGKYPGLRFDENNVHGQCLRCNHFMSGNLIEYEKHLRVRIGNEKVEALHFKASQFKRAKHKWNRFYLIEVINKC